MLALEPQEPFGLTLSEEKKTHKNMMFTRLVIDMIQTHVHPINNGIQFHISVIPCICGEFYFRRPSWASQSQVKNTDWLYLYIYICSIFLAIISWVIFNHARPTYETIRNIKSNHALESSHGETALG